jgi:hypothetical protein
MCSGLSGVFSIFLRSLTMKLSTVRFEGPPRAPDLLEDLVARDGLACALVQQPQELDLVERELVSWPSRDDQRVRGEVHLGVADGEGLAVSSPRARCARRSMARMRAVSSPTLKGLVT